MMTNVTHHRHLKVLPVLLMLGGGTMIILAFIADKLGYGDAGSFGIGQFLLALVGLVVLLVGLLGKKFLKLYQTGAVLLLNTLVLLAIIEVGAIIVGRSYFQVKHTSIQDLPYYTSQTWTKLYWQEAIQAENYRYQPYVTWSHLPFTGETVNYSQEGFRLTPGAECSPDAYTVFTFGGSTMMGWGSPDWGTIPAYLQTELEDQIEGPVCVVNLAEDGYVSTQSLVGLILQLQAGNIPNLVIFYDGVNEVIAAHEARQPSVHVTLAQVADRFEQKEHPLVTWGKGTRTFTLIQRWANDLNQWRQSNSSEDLSQKGIENDTANLAASVAETYFSNYKIVGALAQEYDFDFFFFLQPHLAVEGKTLTTDEKIMKSSIDPKFAVLAKAVYDNIALKTPNHEYFWNLTDVFNEEETQIWIDEVGHITPEGNHLVAQEILNKINGRFAERQ